MDEFSQVEQIGETLRELHRAGWSIGSTAFANLSGGVSWTVDGWNGKNIIRADGATEAAAWRAAIDQARGLGMLCGMEDRGRPWSVGVSY